MGLRIIDVQELKRLKEAGFTMETDSQEQMIQAAGTWSQQTDGGRSIPQKEPGSGKRVQGDDEMAYD